MGGTNSIATGDFNGDHKLDVAILCFTVQTSFQISVLLGDGKGGFQAPSVINVPALASFGKLLAADMNGDGKADLIFTEIAGQQATTMPCGTLSESGRTNTVVTMLAQGNATFGQGILTQTSGFSYTFQSADLNGDGIPDIVLNDGSFMLGHKDGTFSTPAPLPPPTGDCVATAQQVADFNHDGKPDILASTGSGGLSLFLNQGGGMFSAGTAVVASQTKAPIAADFNGDGLTDLLLEVSATASSVLLGKGGGAFQAPIPGPPVYDSTLFALDLNSDGRGDMLQTIGGGFSPPTGLEIYLSNGDGSFTRSPLTAYASFFPALIADVNGDGLPDILGFPATGANSALRDTLEVLLNTTSLAGVTGAVNGASFGKGLPLPPGALASLFGSGFAASNAQAQLIPLPLSLGGVSVTMGGVPAPLLFVSPTQINFQVPWEINASTASIVVTAGSATLPAFQANIGPVVPGIFTTQSGVGQAIAINPDGSLAGPENSIPGLAIHPAKAGDPLEILATGLGAVSPNVADGANTLDGVRNTAAMPAVLIGGISAPVSFSGLAPQFVGVNQINVTVPAGPAGVVPIQIQAGGITTSSQVTIAVSQ
jgi:uncharacterized protein (TIGR03437 family)